MKNQWDSSESEVEKSETGRRPSSTRMLQEISPAWREVGVLSVKWMVERRMEEHEEVKVFREGSGPNEMFNFGKHMGGRSGRCM